MKSSRQLGCTDAPSKSLVPASNAYMMREVIPDGEAGINRTVQIMKGLAHGVWGARSWKVRQAAIDAARGTERGMDEIAAVLDWVKRNIEFRGEKGEWVQSPEATLEIGAGDCDCESTLAAAMLESLGFETRFKTVAMIDAPDDLSHVYVEAKDKRTGQWVPLDSTVARSWPGWEPDNVARSVSYMPTPAPGGFNLGGLIFAGAAAFLLNELFL